MSKSEPWLSKPTPIFAEAHPNIADVDFEINNSAFGHYQGLGHNPIKVTLASVRPHYGCPNRSCKDGGLNFDQILSNFTLAGGEIVEIDQRFACGGYEIKRTGRNSGRDCDNYFGVKGTITLKP